MSLVNEAVRVGPALAVANSEAMELRKLPDHSWALLQESGVLRALQPARFGGGEVPLPEFVDCVVELSKSSPSAGWVAGVIGVHPWQLALSGAGAGGDVGPGSRSHAFVVVQPHR